LIWACFRRPLEPRRARRRFETNPAI